MRVVAVHDSARLTAKAKGHAMTKPPSSGAQKRKSPTPASIAPGTSSTKPLSISSMIAIETVSAARAIGTIAASGRRARSSGSDVRL